MLEMIIGAVTIVGWIAGLWYYPHCMDDAADCCERTCMQRDGLIIDEALAEYGRNIERQQRRDQLRDVVTARLIELGDSPKLSNQAHIPIAKSLKIQ